MVLYTSNPAESANFPGPLRLRRFVFEKQRVSENRRGDVGRSERMRCGQGSLKMPAVLGSLGVNAAVLVEMHQLSIFSFICSS